MNVLRHSVLLAAMFAAAFAQQASAQITTPPGNSGAFFPPGKQPSLVGTIGDCNNVRPGGPCTQTSTLVELDPNTGALIRTIGPVGFTVNGLAWDSTTRTLYATTAIGCGLVGSVCPFHGLITIDRTGKGTPVNPLVHNFGIEGVDVPIRGLAVDVFGHMVSSYPIPPQSTTDTSDTYVRIDQTTGIATEFDNTGINTAQNGISFGEFNVLWNINRPDPVTGQQNAFLINPFNGLAVFQQPLNPPTIAALGDFHPVSQLYYGLNFTGFSADGTTFIEVIDVPNGIVTTLGQTVNFLHTIAFVDK
jgi:hypothetical protein